MCRGFEDVTDRLRGACSRIERLGASPQLTELVADGVQFDEALLDGSELLGEEVTDVAAG